MSVHVTLSFSFLNFYYLYNLHAIKYSYVTNVYLCNYHHGQGKSISITQKHSCEAPSQTILFVLSPRQPLTCFLSL